MVCLISQGEVDMPKYRRISPHYLSNLKVDIIDNNQKVDSTLLMDIASKLPCLEIPPEEDFEKFLSDVFPNDLRIQGNPEFPSVHQWPLLGPKSGSQFGQNVVGAWDVFSGKDMQNTISVGCGYACQNVIYDSSLGICCRKQTPRVHFGNSGHRFGHWSHE